MCSSDLRLSSDSSARWQGVAGGKYTASIQPQVSAISQYQSNANAISAACNDVANAGNAFYAGIAAVVVTFIATLPSLIGAAITAIVGFGGAIGGFHAAIQSDANDFRVVGEPTAAFDGTKSAGSIGGWPQAVAS